MANAIAHARQRFFDAQGVPLAFGKVWTYNAGTTVPRPTFADAGEVTANPNPVILDANGEATIYWNGYYKVNLTTAADVQVPGWPEDNITTLATNANAGSSSFSSQFFTMTAGQTVIDLTTITYVTGTNSVDVFINGLKLRTGLDYTETGPAVITLTSPAVAGDEVEVRAIQSFLVSDAADLAAMLLSPATAALLSTSTDNNIAAFIAAAAALTDNSELWIPKGDYVFDFSTYTGPAVYPSQGIINLSGKTNVRIHSDGAKIRIINLDTRTKGGWSIIWLNNCSDITIEGIVFDVRGVTGLDVAVPGPSYPIISAIGALGLTWRNLTIRNCEFTSFNPLGADNNSAGTNFQYKQIPVFAQGDSATDTVRGLRIVDNVFRSINTYKIFYLGVGGVVIHGNEFLDTAGLFPAIRGLIHASKGHTVVGNHFEGLKPADDIPANNIRSTDLPAMVWFTGATNKGGGGVSVVGNTFALTGSGGIVIGDCSGASVSSNTFWDRVDMSAQFTVEDDTKACIRLNDEASGAGSFPARDVSIVGNTVSGTVLRKIVQVTHALDGVIDSNVVESARGYAFKCAKARRFTISGNAINNVALFGGAQEAIFVNTGPGVVSDTEPVTVIDNTVNGTAGTALSTSSYTPVRLKANNNKAVGGITPKTAGVQDQMATDFLTFGNDPTRVSAGASDLDWYEEGTFTPTIVGTSTAGTGTYTTQIGHFTRVGDTVSFDVTITWTAHTGTGNTEISGLPYAARNTTNKITPVSVFQSGGPVPGANKQRTGIIAANSSRVALREFDTTTAVVGNSNAITGTGTLCVSGVYRV